MGKVVLGAVVVRPKEEFDSKNSGDLGEIGTFVLLKILLLLLQLLLFGDLHRSTLIGVSDSVLDIIRNSGQTFEGIRANRW